MNLLIGFVILLCLVCSEIQTAQTATDLWTRVLMVGLVSMTVPGLALFQTLVVTQRFRKYELTDQQKESMVRRLSTCHSAVWLAASLAIVWAVRWQDIVRGNWHLDRWPLVDDLLIIAPILLSLTASWMIFYDIQRSLDSSRSIFDRKEIKKRIEFTSIRFRIYGLLVLVPIGFVILGRDLSPWYESLPLAWQCLSFLGAALTIAAGFPFLLLLIWKHRPVDDLGLYEQLTSLFRSEKLRIHDIRIWNTGGNIANALVAGFIPRLRIILLSDALIQRFTRGELLAIARHEAGHLRLWHLPMRTVFIVLPLFALAMDERNPSGLLNWLSNELGRQGFPPGLAVAILGCVYVSYVFLVLRWLSHQMEYEADLYACQVTQDENNRPQIEPENASHMTDALFRLAAISPAQYEKSTWLHPSIRNRIALIEQVTQSPSLARAFSRSFARRRRVLLLIILIVSLVPCLVWI